MQARSLEGSVCAVTGASSGIGEATALALAGAGAAVSLAARRAERIEALAERIVAGGGRAIAVPTDVSDEEQARAFVEQTTERLGAPDVLVNNAGAMLIGPVEGADTERWRRMIDANVYGVLYCTHAALPAMRETGHGHIVNVSSIAGRRANPYFAVYNLTKFGVTAFSEALRQELAESEIRVTVVEPGFVDTELTSHNDEVVRQGSEQMKEKLVKVLDPEDVAAAILDAVTRPAHVNISEVVVMPTRQK